jgi:hypothetical protein
MSIIPASNDNAVPNEKYIDRNESFSFSFSALDIKRFILFGNPSITIEIDSPTVVKICEYVPYSSNVLKRESSIEVINVISVLTILLNVNINAFADKLL